MNNSELIIVYEHRVRLSLLYEVHNHVFRNVKSCIYVHTLQAHNNIKL